MWRCFSSAGKRGWSVEVASHSCYIFEICPIPMLWKWGCMASIFPLFYPHTHFVLFFHFKTLVESYILLIQGKIPPDTTKWPFQSFQFRSYLLSAFGKCSVYLSQQKDFPSWMGNSKTREKGYSLCLPAARIQAHKETLVSPLCFICQLSLMIYFLKWVVISD